MQSDDDKADEPIRRDRNPSGVIWIDWGRHLRTHSLAHRLEIPLVEIVPRERGALRYVKCIARTIRELGRRRPPVVVATNPSLVLGLFLVLVRPVYGFELVSDAHFLGVETHPTSPVPQWLLDLHNRAVNMVIVTNEAHARHIRSLGTEAFVCPDPLPRIDPPDEPLDLPDRSALLICSYDADEPFREALSAFQSLGPEGFSFFVSGDYTKVDLDPGNHPHVRFLGFVDDETYRGYLHASDVVVDLTTMENCLVCGAYEALSLSKPLVLSQSEAQATYFENACVFTENRPSAIADSIRLAYEQREKLSRNARSWTKGEEAVMAGRMEALRGRLFRNRASRTTRTG